MSKPLSRVWVSEELLREMIREADGRSPNETGGVLMGYFSGNEAVVTEIAGPGPKAIHRKSSFSPDYEFQTERIAESYERSDRLSGYLGDWHTHPQGSLTLSSKDRGTLRRIAHYKEARVLTPVMLLLAGGRDWRIGAWSYEPRRVMGFGIGRVRQIAVKEY